MREQPRVVRVAMGTERKAIKGMFWGMRKDHADWSVDQINTMYRLQRSNLKSARAWRLKEALRSTYAAGVTSNCPEKAEAALKSRMSWARRSRLEPFEKLATTLEDHMAGVGRSMVDGRSNAYVEAMNGMLQQVKRAHKLIFLIGPNPRREKSASASANCDFCARVLSENRFISHSFSSQPR